MSAIAPDKRPWYAHRWPWLLMAGPAVVVVAGIVTAWIAATTSDGLVADDYYKQGLAINQRLARQDAAAAMQLEARL
ncbi:MAG: FixH family protein, partial [Rhodocyclaceae bacterium]|nr:FixH family protein [Rhodocyclaceae bacterium]